MKRKFILEKTSRIEKTLKKYAVSALEEDHVIAFSHKKDPP